MPKVNFQGKDVDATEVEFQIRKEDWNEYQLLDGTVLKMKLVVSTVLRVDGEYDNEGNPAYYIKSATMPAINAPDTLKRKTKSRLEGR